MIVEEVGQYYLVGKPVGALYFKHLANKRVVDMAVASSHLRHILMHLPDNMLTINSNVSKFNKYVHVNCQSLLTCGEQVNDSIHNLFSGYTVAQDCKFREYIAKKKESVEEGTVMMPDELMTYTLNYYKTRCECKEWGQKAAEKHIVALTGTIKGLCDANLKLAKSLATVKKGNKNTSKEKTSDTQADLKMPKTHLSMDGWLCHHHPTLLLPSKSMVLPIIDASTTKLGSIIPKISAIRSPPRRKNS
eukprot:1798044-Ditylum_brightwellii.AAC.1